MIRIMLATALLFAVATPVEAQNARRCYRPLFGIFVTPCRDRDYSIPELEPLRRPHTNLPANGTGLDAGVNVRTGKGNGIGGSAGGSVNANGKGLGASGGVSVGGKSVGGSLSIK